MEFDPASVETEIEEALSTVKGGDECEIAFFGGSFTGIDRDLMVDLLNRAEKYVEDGRVSSIRLSTRPDYIDDEILDILSSYSVKTIELGLQSLSDKVLIASGRGHDASIARHACRAIKERGFSLVGQMMIGLPESDEESEKETARNIIELGADGARVYPTVVFRDTELEKMTYDKRYAPLSNEEAVMRTASVLDIFDRAGVPCIRVGLCASDNLSDPESAVAGANHPAIGEMAMSELFYRRICERLDALDVMGADVTVYVSSGSLSKAVGHKKKNKEKICEKYGIRRIKVLEKKELLGYNIIIECCKNSQETNVTFAKK